MMEAIVQWVTILSPIIAVLLAWCAAKSSSKETNKQIAAMQENTEKEIKQLKELATLEVEALSLKLDAELIQKSLIAQQADEERKGLNDVMSINDLTFQDISLRRFESQQPERNHKYMMAYLQELKKFSQRLNQIKQQINKG